jgi:hypothetical protein
MTPKRPYPPLELDVNDAGVAELVVAAGLGHGAERRAAEVEVVLGHGVVVHVSDDHRLGVAGACRVLLASYLGKKINDGVSQKSKLFSSFPFPINKTARSGYSKTIL